MLGFCFFFVSASIADKPLAVGKAVTRCRDIGVLVAMLATPTDVRGVSLSGTGGRRYGVSVVVTEFGKLARLVMITVFANSPFLTDFRTGGRGDFRPITKVVTRGGYVGVVVRVWTATAPMLGVSLRFTGGGDDRVLIVVTEYGKLARLVIPTACANAPFLADLRASGRCRFSPITENMIRYGNVRIGVFVLTALALMRGIAFRGTGRRCYRVFVIMTERRNQRIRVFIRTTVAFVCRVSLSGTSGRRYGSPVVVTERRNQRIRVFVRTTAAFVRGVSPCGTGGRYYGLPVVVTASAFRRGRVRMRATATFVRRIAVCGTGRRC